MKQDAIKPAKLWELPLLLTAAGALLYVLLLALPYIAPVILGAILSSALEPLIRRLERLRTGGVCLGRTAAVLVCLLLLIAITGVLVFRLVSALLAQAAALANALPTLWPELNQQLSAAAEGLLQGLGVAPEQLRTIFDALSGQLSLWIQELTALMGGWLLRFAMGIPGGILAALLSLLSAFFLAKDRPKYRAFFQNSFPLSFTRTAKRLYASTLKALLGYIKAQGILMGITFMLMMLSFHLMQIGYPVLLAAVIAFFDALPAIGAGVFLIPWSLGAAVLGNYPMAAGVGVLYLVQTVTRQCVEPRIVGQHIGLNPVITMSSMYAGLRLCGLQGLLFAPFCVIILKSTALIYLDGKTYREKVDGIFPHEN